MINTKTFYYIYTIPAVMKVFNCPKKLTNVCLLTIYVCVVKQKFNNYTSQKQCSLIKSIHDSYHTFLVRKDNFNL